ncbi:putative ABC transport system permease protein [Bacillus horti]|uniref:ABC transport system permease protein n=2 Tax=Caldalkalibacillus horti TaxID=77523 RepID=A0ABT9VUU4_9BACI|nr:putative ABC transport system permease protein [Bacillus horti]
MLKKDFLKKKIITVSLFVFITLSALLVASGSNMILELFHSMNSLFERSSAPHFVQMHAGEVDQGEIEDFSSRNSLVQDKQIAEMLNIDGSSITLGNSSTPEQLSVMDHYFVKQNESFDFLLNLESEVINVSMGEIAVPIYFMQQGDMAIGDKVTIAGPEHDLEFRVVEFVRDVQMNPSIIHSKRFVVHEADFNQLKNSLGELEYLIEFQLTDESKISEFRQAYQSANLPNRGPDIDLNLFMTLNALTDGIVAVVIILVSLLLIVIALLCIRFTILAAVEEDLREIGVMKAIGIKQKDIKRLYLFKYIFLGALGSLLGYIVSLFINHLFTGNIMLYLGTAPKSLLQYMIPLLSVGLIFLIVVLFCLFVLRAFNKISAVEALRSGSMGGNQKASRFLSLYKSKLSNLQLFLGLKDVMGRFRMYALLFFVFFICSFIIIVPVHFLNTIQSPSFITYMGIEKSDIRIDLQQSESITEDFNDMLGYIQNDQDVERFSPLVTSQFKFINDEGLAENLTVETGDYSIFPLEYLEGSAPRQENEIALSYLNGDEMGKEVGDPIYLVYDGEEREMVVSGIYQDVTNGGRTAKALLPFNEDAVLWYEVSLDLKSVDTINDKMLEYSEAFYPARVTDIEGYLSNTLGNTIEQLRLVTILAIIIAISVTVLITSLFLKMLVAKDYSKIVIMKSLGFSSKDVRTQYVIRALLVLVLGIVCGTIFSNTIGQVLISAVMSFVGAANISFVINPLQAYILCPLLLILTVTITTLLSVVSVNKSSIAEMNAG